MIFIITALLILQTLPTACTNSQTAETKQGVIFNLKQQILLTEKFVKIDILVPFPSYEAVIEQRYMDLSNEIEKLWTYKNYGCPLNFTNLEDHSSGLRWIANEVLQQNKEAQGDIKYLIDEIGSLLRHSGTDSAQLHRQTRGLPAILAGAAAVLGVGIAGSKVVCVLKTVFGGCDDGRIKQNQKNIEAAYQYMNIITDEIKTITSEQNDKFFMVAGELRDVRAKQQVIIDTQNKNWEAASKQFAIIRNNTNEMRNCLQYLYTRQQTGHHSIILQSFFQTLYTNIKSYRAALYAFRINILNALAPLINQYLPISLIPREQLRHILTTIHLGESGNADRLTLAIPPQEILSYYESKLVTNVVPTKAGLMLTLAIPMASRTTVLNVLHAIPIPMPDGQSGRAFLWRPEAKYLAISMDNQELALINDEDLDLCIGSTRYSICTKAIPTDTSKHSCLATLFFHSDHMMAIERCKMDIIQLPRAEKAQNIGFGRWLIMAASSNYKSVETASNGSNPLERIEHPGCRVCILTLACGRQLAGDNIRLRSDLSACALLPSIRLDVTLPDPLANIFELIPPLEELPHFSSIAEAQQQVFDDIQPKFQFLETSAPDREALHKLAAPIVSKLRHMKPEFDAKFGQYIPWKWSLCFGLLSFFISIALHWGYSHLIHKWIKIHKRFPFRTLHEGRKIKTLPVSVVKPEDYEFLQAHPEHPLHKCALVLPLEIQSDFSETADKKSTYTFLRQYLSRLRKQDQEATEL